MLDVDRWAEWLDTVTEAAWVDSGPTRVGRRARLVQPRLGTAEWEVTELEPDRSFVWTRRSPGVTTVAGHYLAENAGKAIELTLTLDHSGPLAWLARLLTDRTARRYIESEARCIKARSEAEHAPETTAAE